MKTLVESISDSTRSEYKDPMYVVLHDDDKHTKLMQWLESLKITLDKREYQTIYNRSYPPQLIRKYTNRKKDMLVEYRYITPAFYSSPIMSFFKNTFTGQYIITINQQYPKAKLEILDNILKHFDYDCNVVFDDLEYRKSYHRS